MALTTGQAIASIAVMAAVTIVFLLILGGILGPDAQQKLLLVSLGVIVLFLLVFRERLEEKPDEKQADTAGEEARSC